MSVSARPERLLMSSSPSSAGFGPKFSISCLASLKYSVCCKNSWLACSDLHERERAARAAFDVVIAQQRRVWPEVLNFLLGVVEVLCLLQKFLVGLFRSA